MNEEDTLYRGDGSKEMAVSDALSLIAFNGYRGVKNGLVVISGEFDFCGGFEDIDFDVLIKYSDHKCYFKRDNSNGVYYIDITRYGYYHTYHDLGFLY